MTLKIYPVNLGTVTLDSSNLVLFRNPGSLVTIPTLCSLIVGGTEPIFVDTGSRNFEQYAAFGMGAGCLETRWHYNRRVTPAPAARLTAFAAVRTQTRRRTSLMRSRRV
jgi:hypothetical protein